MDIRNATHGLNGTAPVQPTAPQETDPSVSNVRPGAPETAQRPDTLDRLELSRADASRPARLEQTPGFTFARKALDGVNAPNEERLAAIRERIDSGFYTRPDVLETVAGRVADELTGDLEAKANLHSIDGGA